jgi:hypothetical protein
MPSQLVSRKLSSGTSGPYVDGTQEASAPASLASASSQPTTAPASHSLEDAATLVMLQVAASHACEADEDEEEEEAPLAPHATAPSEDAARASQRML